jgi:hypothetical protein
MINVVLATYQTTYAQVSTHVRLGDVDVLYVYGDRVRVLTAALMTLKNAAWMQPGYLRNHHNQN